MNKAFTKEPEATGGHCPRCGSIGIAVGEATLAAFVRPEFLAEIADAAYFCDFQKCEVAYFDAFERVIEVGQLGRPVWPKDLAAPLCGCFGLCADDVAADVREGGVTRVKDVVLRSKTDAARCLTNSPTGASCAAVVQRHYFRLRAESAG